MTELEKNIVCFIEATYKVQFLGKVKVHIDGESYCLELVLNSYQTPYWICIDSKTPEEFYNKITHELLLRNYVKVDYYKVKLNNYENGFES